ncbi:hypothetical protein O6H91_03G005700 [Diphasiastrum complanatum]|uniref:Uncharacterized protein n=1 Tax=Diphasiastrum complanatum TaxID=34168 RepID=A0ACC2E3D5_DIPCM|nr:hypothetical protein O6H91_03G005700 [Diphasiastrum complanatum]
MMKSIAKVIRSMMQRRPGFDADYEAVPPMMERRIRYNSSFSRLRHKKVSCVRFRKRKAKRLITVLVGPERQAFSVEPHLLDHGVMQFLVDKTGSPVVEESDADCGNFKYGCGILKLSKEKASQATARIHINCDAILFDHIVWLLHNDDPSIRHLNIDELLEFYRRD